MNWQFWKKSDTTSFDRNSIEAFESVDRLQATIETELEDKQLTEYDDYELVTHFRNMYNNNSQIRAWFRQFHLNVVSSGQRPVFRSPDDKFNQDAAVLFRKKSKQWEGRGSYQRSEMDKLVLETTLLEGEILVFYDSAGIINAGRFLYFRRDRMPEIDEQDFNEKIAIIAKGLGVDPYVKVGDKKVKNLIQNKGIIEDRNGITLGFVVSNKPATMAPLLEQVTVITNSDNIMLLTWDRRVNSKHGNSILMPIAKDIADTNSLRKSAVKKAAAQAQFAIAMKVKDAKRKQLTRAGNDVQDIMKKDRSAERKMNNIEKLGQGGDVNVEYISPDESIEAITLGKGDADEIKNMYTMSVTIGGFALGLSRLFSTGDASHATFASLMAETNLAQSTFIFLQEWIAQELYEFQLRVVIQDAIAKGELKEPPLSKDGLDWEETTYWTGFPKMRSLNPLQDIKAFKEKVSMGGVDPEEVFGADWEDRLDEWAEVAKKLEEKELNLDLFPEKKQEPVLPEDEPEDKPENKDNGSSSDVEEK